MEIWVFVPGVPHNGELHGADCSCSENPGSWVLESSHCANSPGGFNDDPKTGGGFLDEGGSTSGGGDGGVVTAPNTIPYDSQIKNFTSGTLKDNKVRTYYNSQSNIKNTIDWYLIGKDFSYDSKETAKSVLTFSQNFNLNYNQFNLAFSNWDSQAMADINNYLTTVIDNAETKASLKLSLNLLINGGSIELAIQTMEILSLPFITSNVQIDYVTQILRLTNHLKKFGNIEDEIYADYIESLIPDFNSMTITEVRAIYSEVKTTCNQLTTKYAIEILTPVVTDLIIPVVTYALFEATAGTAIKLLQKIPNIVLQGTRLSATISQLTQLGSPGIKTNVRVIATSAPVARAESLFLSLTRNVKPTEVSPGVLRAAMGNGNFITFRTISTSGFPATIDLNFPLIFGANSPIKVLKFTAL